MNKTYLRGYYNGYMDKEAAGIAEWYAGLNDNERKMLHGGIGAAGLGLGGAALGGALGGRKGALTGGALGLAGGAAGGYYGGDALLKLLRGRSEAAPGAMEQAGKTMPANKEQLAEALRNAAPGGHPDKAPDVQLPAQVLADIPTRKDKDKEYEQAVAGHVNRTSDYLAAGRGRDLEPRTEAEARHMASTVGLPAYSRWNKVLWPPAQTVGMPPPGQAEEDAEAYRRERLAGERAIDAVEDEEAARRAQAAAERERAILSAYNTSTLGGI